MAVLRDVNGTREMPRWKCTHQATHTKAGIDICTDCGRILDEVFEGKVRAMQQVQANPRREVQERRSHKYWKGNNDQEITREVIEKEREMLKAKGWMLCIFCNDGLIPHGSCGIRCPQCGGYLDCADGGIN